MALMDQQQNDGLYNSVPQQNQTLTGNPSTDPNAQTSWMSPSVGFNPSQASPSTGINGGGGASSLAGSQTPPSQTASGTMLGQISAGNVSQYAPPGFDQTKWSDPNKHDPKYDVGRILSKYPASTQGLQAAMGELGPMGYTMTGKDTIVGPDGIPVDVGFAFGSGEGAHWQWNPNDPNAVQGASVTTPQQSMLGQQANNPWAANEAAQQQWQQLQQMRQIYANQQFNPTGGSVPYNPYTTPQQPPMFANQPQLPTMNPSVLGSFLQQMQNGQLQQPQIGTPNPNWTWQGLPAGTILGAM